MTELEGASAHAMLMAELAEAITHKIDKFYQLRTEYAELLSKTDTSLQPIKNILYQRDILYKFNEIAAQGLFSWKKADILKVQENYDIFLFYLRTQKHAKRATPYELQLYDAFYGGMGKFFSALLKDMLVMTDKRDRHEE